MEATLSRLQGLSPDELRDELVKANIKCGPITATTRAIFERKLARALVSEDGSNGSSNGASETDSGSSTSTSSSSSSCSNSGTSATGTPNPEPRTPSASAEPQASEDGDFGYGMGLNPPEEEALTEKAAALGCVRADVAQPDGQTPSKPTQVSPPFYYGVCPPWEDMLVRTGMILFFYSPSLHISSLASVFIPTPAHFHLASAIQMNHLPPAAGSPQEYPLVD